MKIIIDDCVPSIAKCGLPDRDIVTVQERGWAGIKNGELLKLVVFVTSDKNIKHQQNLSRFDIPQLDAALDKIEAREFVEL